MNIDGKKEPNQSAHDFVYKGLRTRIMHGEILPATSMTLRGIGKEYSVSMTPAREAVRRLIAEGAVKVFDVMSFIKNEIVEFLAAEDRSILNSKLI